MFCKFCGETLDPSQRKCRRCGREVPASTDCGGYYDVIKDLERRGITDSKTPTQVYVTQKAPESKLWVFTMICAGLLIAVILLQLILIKKIDGVRAVVDEYDPCECSVASEDVTEDASNEEENADDNEKTDHGEIIDEIKDGLKTEENNEDAEQSQEEEKKVSAEPDVAGAKTPNADGDLESSN